MRILVFLSVIFALIAVGVLVAALVASSPSRSESVEVAALRAQLQRQERELESRALSTCRTRGTVTWPEFDADQDAHAGKCVELRNSDLAHGTAIVRRGAVLRWMEDIEFAPNAAHDFTVRRPHQNARYPLRSGFELGFFAAIAIVANETVIVDGMGHTLSQHPMHTVLQRFYSHIELASSAFVSGEGPAGFGPVFRAASNVVIKNANFGRSSHFAVAGNGNANLFMHDLRISDYEVAAFKLNGLKNAHLRDIDATGHRTDIAVNGEFSQTTFILQKIRQHAHNRSPELDDAYRRLLDLHNAARADIAAKGKIDEVAHREAYHLFAAKSSVQTGGTTYCGVITDKGAAVGPIQMAFTPETASYDVLIERMSCNNTISHTIEFVSIADADNKLIHGPIGGIWNLPRIAEHYGSLRRDPLVAVMVEYTRYINSLPPSQRMSAGKANIPQVLIDHYDATGAPLDASFAAFLEANGFHVVSNMDGMGHVNKGLMIIRVQSSQRVYLIEISLGYAIASGDAPFQGKPVWSHIFVNPLSYTGANNSGGHPQQAPMIGYHGNDAHGLAVSSSHDVSWNNVKIGTIKSLHGAAIGLEQFSPA